MADLSLSESYKLLNITNQSTDDEITKSFKKLALKYHPDRNQQRVAWANSEMARINQAYSLVMSNRFQQPSPEPEPEKPTREKKTAPSYSNEKAIIKENLIKHFSKIRGNTNESLYRYFQYTLFNFNMRDKISNKSIFNEIVQIIKGSFHSVKQLRSMTEDSELIEHFNVFNNMIFNFYKASECLNILDSYNNQIDVEAYRLYHEGDDILHRAHKEVFYDRHNRGYFEEKLALPAALKAKIFFSEAIKNYPESSWVVESKIKLDYTISLIKYIELFFSEE